MAVRAGRQRRAISFADSPSRPLQGALSVAACWRSWSRFGRTTACLCARPLRSSAPSLRNVPD
eukprot:9426141-Lingulodinium_polyedra.AAC.1